MVARAETDLCAAGFESIRGWDTCDFASIWPVLRALAEATLDEQASLRPAQPPDVRLTRLFRMIVGERATPPAAQIRRLFERHCDVGWISSPGFLTGYYEPVVEGSFHPAPGFAAPILPRPADLVTLSPGRHEPAIPEAYAAARRRADGGLELYADRTALEAWALGPEAQPLVWLRDWAEVFLIHVQGSARVRLPDGRERRLVYAGRNGHPYTSIGRILVETGEIPTAEMSLARLKGWIRDHGQEVGQPGRALMQRNRSYIFFDLVENDNAEGPTGGAGLSLTAGVSVAVDRNLWPYGLPFWIETDVPVPGFGPAPLARLFVAQDTGSAIVGPARIDLFLGSGDTAGEAAGRIRHAARVAVLSPKLA